MQARQLRNDCVLSRELGTLCKWMHNNQQVSRVDNQRSKPVRIYSTEFDENGNQMFDEHQVHRLKISDTAIWDLFKQTTEWKRLQESWSSRVNNDPLGRKPIRYLKGGPWMVAAAKCRCMKKDVISVCSCPHCTELNANLETLRNLRPQWLSKTTCTCPSIDGKKVCESNEYKQFLESSITMEKYLMCSKVAISEMSVPEVDDNDCELTGQTIQCKMHNLECQNHGKSFTDNEIHLMKQALEDVRKQHSLKPTANTHSRIIAIDNELKASEKQMSSEPSNICENCGWNNTLKQWGLPPHIVTGETGNDSWAKVVYGCSKELNDDKVEWGMFGNIQIGVKEDGSPQLRKEWLPICGTRLQFFAFLKNAFEKFERHIFQVRWNRVVERRLTHARIQRPLLQGKQVDILLLQSDFASKFEHTKQFTGTCCHSESTNCLVISASFGFSKIEISEEKRKRMRKEYRNRTHKFVQQNECFYFFSKAKADSTYVNQCTLMAIQMIKQGELSSEFGNKGVEAFRGNFRLPGSSKKVCLVEGLTDSDESIPLTNENLKTIVHRRDGCAVQYQCKHAAYQNSWFINHLNELLDLKEEESRFEGLADCRRPAHHGKCVCDGLGLICFNVMPMYHSCIFFSYLIFCL